MRPPNKGKPTTIPASMSKMYHIPAGGWYAIENSPYGLATAEAHGYPWIDMDLHYTKDGVGILGHDRNPKDDHFIVSSALTKKYKDANPSIENMTWADVKALRTSPVTWEGKSITLRYYTLEEVMAWLGDHPKMSVSFEMKNSKQFEDPKTFVALRDLATENGVALSRIAVMSIAWPDYNHLLRFKGAHAWFKTIILPHELAKPANLPPAEPYIDYYRGPWK